MPGLAHTPEPMEGRSGFRRLPVPGRSSMEAALHADHCGAEAPLDETQETFSLTYSEIGEGLCSCVDSGVITMEQAREIGNHLFPSPLEKVS